MSKPQAHANHSGWAAAAIAEDRKPRIGTAAAAAVDDHSNQTAGSKGRGDLHRPPLTGGRLYGASAIFARGSGADCRPKPRNSAAHQQLLFQCALAGLCAEE